MSNYSANTASVAAAPIKGGFAEALRGGNINCAAKIRHPRSEDNKIE